MDWLNTGMAGVAAYLLGSVPFGFLIALARSQDIRKLRSGNIGATHVWREVGKTEGLVAFVLDVGKGLAAVLVVAPLFKGTEANLTTLVAGLAVILGHVFPVYLKFRGGKAVATSLGVLVSLAWLPVVIAVGVFIVVVALWRFISLGSISAALALVAAEVVVTEDPFGVNLPLTVFCLLVAALVIARHRSNIVRLVRGSENRFDMARKSL